MRKIFTAGLTALSLVLIPAAPVQAQQNNNDLNRAILGLLAAGAIGLAIKNSNNRQSSEVKRSHAGSHSPQAHRPQQVHNNRGNHGNKHNRAQRQRRVDLVPGRCFRRVETARGGYQGVFLSRCLERRYRDANTLPRQCAVRVGGRDGRRQGYDASCLRDFGYRSDRRWN